MTDQTDQREESEESERPENPAAGPSSGPGAWRLFHGDGVRRGAGLPEPPPWRRFRRTGADEPPVYVISEPEADVVNAALHLRRPLLVTGHPGTGKSSLARAVAYELELGEVLHWPVNSRSTLQDALYRYDAIGRLQETNRRKEAGLEAPGVGTFLRLGPLGTALAQEEQPRVLLVDELDKGDVDLPNDLLTVFEQGTFEIPELSRLPEEEREAEVLTADPHVTARVERGLVTCAHFPVVVITSNGERDFPPAFRRRCVPLHLTDPDERQLRGIIAGHLGEEALAEADDLVTAFLAQRAAGELATDQLLNAVFLRNGGVPMGAEGLLATVLHRLSAGG